MTQPAPSPQGDRDRDGGGLPRWAVLLAIALAVVALLVGAALMLGIGGGHTPVRHGLGEATHTIHL